MENEGVDLYLWIHLDDYTMKSFKIGDKLKVKLKIEDTTNKPKN